MALTIAQAVVRIIRREPFYGLFLIGINKYFDNSIDTACVQRIGLNIEILINEDYWNSLEDELKINLLLHECLHIIYKHTWMQEDFENKDRFNISSDLHVNSFLWKLDPDWYNPTDFGFEPGLGTKWYYENLPENIGYNPFDSHNWKGFSNLSEAEKQLISNQIDYQVKQIAEQIMKTPGSIPGHLKEYIDGLFKKRDKVFNWKSYFRRILGNSIKSYLKSTKYRPSKRFKDQPGLVLKFKPKVLVAVDTSGSVSNDELRDFFTEIDHLYKSGVQVEIVEFDTKIQNHFVYKGQSTDIKIVGRGGTDMTDVYNLYISRPDFSTLVVFTDGCLNTDFPLCKNMIWVISSNGDHKSYPGRTIYIPNEK